MQAIKNSDLNAPVNKRNNSDNVSAERVLMAPSQLKYIPSIRFVPKKYSMRPITNLRSASMKSKSKDGGVSEVNAPANATDTAPFLVSNSSLYSCLHVLRDISSRNPSLCGFGTLGTDDVYAKLREYKMHCCKALDEMKELEESKWRVSDDNNSSNEDSECNVPEKVSALVRNRSFQRYLSTQSQQATAAKRPPIASPYKDLSELKFYIAAVDLDKCYDTVDTHQLYSAVKEIVLQHGRRPLSSAHAEGTTPGINTEVNDAESSDDDDDEHANLVHKYSVSHYIPSLEKAVTKTIRTVTRGNDLIPLSGKQQHQLRSAANSI